MKKLIAKIFKKGRKIQDTIDRYQEAITFAEAGATGPEIDVSPRMEEENGILLVMSQQPYFKQEMIDYAIDMARRMDYEIIALNTAPIPEETRELIEPSSSKLQEFEKNARQNAESFRKAAEKENIAFEHIVRFGEPDDIVQQLCRSRKNIEFIVSEPEKERLSTRNTAEKRLEKELIVYSVAM